MCRLDWFVVFVVSITSHSLEYAAAAVGLDIFRPDAGTLAELMMQMQSK
jgi:hypothetical protein